MGLNEGSGERWGWGGVGWLPCTEAFWELVTLRPSFWLSMRNGENVTKAKWS